MKSKTGHLMNEADIGSGEKKPGDHDTDEEISKVHNPKLSDDGAPGGKTEQSQEKDRQDSQEKP